MAKLFLTAYSYEDDSERGLIYELWDMKNDTLVKSFYDLEPWNWNYNTWTEILGVIIADDIADAVEVELTRNSYQVGRSVLVVSSDIVIDSGITIVEIEKLSEQDLKHLEKYTTLGKKEYLKRLKKRFKAVLENL